MVPSQRRGALPGRSRVSPAWGGSFQGKNGARRSRRAPLPRGCHRRRPALPGVAGAFEGRGGVGALPATLDRHKNTAGISMATYFLLYNGLTRVEEAGQLQPGLAESWRWVNDRVFQLRLRKGVTFHNGEPFDAAVVKWNV